ncbi:MAG: hypothetical protein FWH04_03260 [Oscillospiraceae bacterium]|nr:hypothetical protein [Oscillospiraceae bacterium]
MFEFGVDAVRAMGTLLASLYIFKRSVRQQVTNKQTMLSVLFCMVAAALYAAAVPWLARPSTYLMECLLSIIFILLIIRRKINTVIPAYLFSYCVSNILYYITVPVVTVIFAAVIDPLLGKGYINYDIVDLNQPVYLLLYSAVCALQLLFSALLFKIRRFKNGFPFLFERGSAIMALVFAGTIVFFSTQLNALSMQRNTSAMDYYIAGIAIAGTGIFIWSRRGLQAYRRKRTRENNEKLLRRENTELQREICQLKENEEIFRIANHSIAHRLNAMSRRVAELLEKSQEYNFSAEFSRELAAAAVDIRNQLNEYGAEINAKARIDITLPSTNVRMIDELFGLFAEKFAANGIKFRLIATGSIIYMTENIIKQGRLETLIGDLLQNALIAIEAGRSHVSSILAVIGESGSCYELSVHDSGIPFEPSTLMRLGTERITTRQSGGGSGAGMMKTFETIRECSASLIITENNGGEFSKSVAVRFDNKNQYIIKTHRPDAFPPGDRYTVSGY